MSRSEGAAARCVVFVGPSLSERRHRLPSCVAFRPPARQGDIDAAVASRAELILLIDGVLIYDHPPSPTEVLRALEAGVQVWGGASLGALRAVELRNHGMRGLGWVYERFLDGTIDRDDEVVTPMTADTYRPLAVPLVRIRFALEALRRRGTITEAQAQVAIAVLQEIHFMDRRWDAIDQSLRASGLPEPELKAIRAPGFDVKATDARLCLQELGRWCAS